MILIAFAVVAAILAYIVIPSIGGFRTHHRWQLFRTRIMKSSLLPMVNFNTGEGDGPWGAHRFIGRIEALQDDDSLWVRGEGVSLKAEMAEARIYLFPSGGSMPPVARTLLEERLPEEHPRPMSWKRITSLQEGTRIYLVGFLERREAILRIYGSRDVPLLALLHEGEDVVPRAVWSGRLKNEYWNALTPWSLLAGSLALFIMASAAFLTDQSSWIVRILLTTALSPVIPLLPPGIVLFLLGISNWRRAGFLRAEQDLLRLSAHLRGGDAQDQTAGWGDDIPRDTVPLIQSCRKRALVAGFVAGLAFFTGFAINIFLVILVLKAFV